MEITYDRLSDDELRGSTQADYLVSLDAHLRLIRKDVVVFDEPNFPVVELARSLVMWLRDSGRADFRFESMSYEEPGSIAIWQGSDGWTIGSVFFESPLAPPMTWTEIERSCERFIARVEADLVALGLDPTAVTRR